MLKDSQSSVVFVYFNTILLEALPSVSLEDMYLFLAQSVSDVLLVATSLTCIFNWIYRVIVVIGPKHVALIRILPASVGEVLSKAFFKLNFICFFPEL